MATIPPKTSDTTPGALLLLQAAGDGGLLTLTAVGVQA